MIPNKTIQLNSIRSYTYGNNQSRLQFLPKLITYSIGVIFVLSTLWYLNVYSFTSSNSNAQNASSTPESFIPLQKGLTPIVSSSQSSVTEEIYQDILYQNSTDKCSFSYSKTSSQNLLYSSENEGFWSPVNCNTNITFLQILKLSPDKIPSLVDATNLESSLISNSIYLLIYKNSQVKSNLNFEPYLVNLSQPIFPTEVSFIEATSYDVSTSGNLKFYLVGQCQNFEKNNCKLWQVNNFQGTRDIVFTNFLDVLIQNQLPLDTVVKFAKIQDSLPNAVNLILYQPNQKVIKLIRVSVLNSSVIQIIEINKSEQLDIFNKYYR